MNWSLVAQAMAKGIDWDPVGGRRLCIAFQHVMGARTTGVWDKQSHEKLAEIGSSFGVAVPEFGANPNAVLSLVAVVLDLLEREREEDFVFIVQAFFPDIGAVDRVTPEIRQRIMNEADSVMGCILGFLYMVKVGEQSKGGRRAPTTTGQLVVSALMPLPGVGAWALA